MSGVELRPLTDVPQEEVLALLRTVLGDGPTGSRDGAFWNWKHRASPFGPSPGLVAVDGSTLVAVRVFLRWRWQAAGRTVEGVRAVDTATHPSWRRRGLFRRLTLDLAERCRKEGTHLVFNTPNRHSRPGYLAMGWHDLGRVPVRLRPVALRRRRGRFADLPSVGELLAADGVAARLAAGADAVPAADERLRTARTSRYLRWRYSDVPVIDYRALWDVGDDGFAALVVRRRRRNGLSEGTVAEILVQGPGGERRGAALLRRVAALSGLHYLAAAAPEDSAGGRCLAAAGFRLPALPGPHFTVRPLAAAPAGRPLELAGWNLSIGELELF